ncbi:MAG: hypothetical protein Q7R34_08205 [Dehalococcoidia bacterium]|nr:hypothetical protein [Dehalococcoidia bacterium]
MRKRSPKKSKLAAGYGSVKPQQRPEDLELLCQQATEEAALKRWDKVLRSTHSQ